VGTFNQTKESTIAINIIGAPKISELDANMELENLDLEDLEEEGGRIVQC